MCTATTPVCNRGRKRDLISWGSEENRELFVWDTQTKTRHERATAMRALADVAPKEFAGLLKGVLYWKLSTLSVHDREEPFVLIIGEDIDDPMLAPLSELAKRL